MRTLQSCVHRQDKEREKKARWRARKEAIRIDRHKDEPIRGEWRGKFAFTIIYQNRITDVSHTLDFFISEKRINAFRVNMDGSPWRKQISATETLVWLRKQLPRFSIPA